MACRTADQVYADNAFKAARRFFDDASDLRSVEEKVAAACECYQSVYRRVWNRPETQRVLANVPVRVCPVRSFNCLP